MVLTAALIHGLLLLINLPVRDFSRSAALAIQWVELSAQISPEVQAVDSLEPQPERPPEPEPEPQSIAQNSPEPRPQEPTNERSEAVDTAPATPSAERLRELALIAARAQVETAAPSSPGIEGFAVPRLPSQAGWLNDYVGPIRPHIDRWQEADGAQAMRVVTASGQAYCGRARAPTASEEFNPWKSTALMYWRLCGREQPEPIDRSNPWLRGDGSARD